MKLQNLMAIIVMMAPLAVMDAGMAAGPAPIAGRWAGTVSEPRGAEAPYVYTVYLDISADGKSGTAQYLRYPCGGRLNLVSDTAAGKLFQEHLYYGTTICLDGLQVRVSTASPDEVLFEELVNGSASVSGNLRKLH